MRPDIVLGICGEHGGDPTTIEFCHNVGLKEEPGSIDRFSRILNMAEEVGYEFALPEEVLREAKELIPNERILCIENGVAWHGGTAKAWNNTEHARIMDPVCLSILRGIQAVRKEAGGGQECGELTEASKNLLTGVMRTNGD